MRQMDLVQAMTAGFASLARGGSGVAGGRTAGEEQAELSLAQALAEKAETEVTQMKEQRVIALYGALAAATQEGEKAFLKERIAAAKSELAAS